MVSMTVIIVSMKQKESEVIRMVKEVKIKLTDDTLENIKIMAPLLDESSQNQVFGLMLGILKGINQGNDDKKKTG